MHALLAALGDPHVAVPVLHVAGTNGKGSTAATLEALLGALHEQALTARRLAVEELFAPETHAGLDPEPEAARPS